MERKKPETKSTIERNRAETKVTPFKPLLITAIATLALLMVWTIGSSPENLLGFSMKQDSTDEEPELEEEEDVTWGDPSTFYDDPDLHYTVGSPIRNWDEKRREWFRRHPALAGGSKGRVLMVTGSQPSACSNPIGDHLLLRLFKNKVDYCRIHGYDIFYNNALLDPKMDSAWAKIPVVRAAMLAHPEVEWIWWVDSDAVFTDMDFKPPLVDRYKNYNLVVGGSPELVYENPSWLGLNAGVFYIRNCQWSMDFLEAWAEMGPQTPRHQKWGYVLASAIDDKIYATSDDQSALVYLLTKEKEKWSNKVLLEHEYCIQGYWKSLVGTFYNVTRNYERLEKEVSKLRRRHAEKVSESYGAVWDTYLEKAGYRKDAGKRPCLMHFTGCKPCSGDHDPEYTDDSCWIGMKRALNFADNQVLRNFGFKHHGLVDTSSVSPIWFDFTT